MMVSFMLRSYCTIQANPLQKESVLSPTCLDAASAFPLD